MVQRGQTYWFHDKSGTYMGIVEKINRDTINVIVNEPNNPEGYQLWRVTEFFLSDSPEEAVERWNEYKDKLREVKEILEIRRKNNSFRRGIEVIVTPYEKEPYFATVLSVDRITLIVQTEHKKLMRIDKAICAPTQYYD